jgi:hypothetical protein
MNSMKQVDKMKFKAEPCSLVRAYFAAADWLQCQAVQLFPKDPFPCPSLVSINFNQPSTLASFTSGRWWRGVERWRAGDKLIDPVELCLRPLPHFSPLSPSSPSNAGLFDLGLYSCLMIQSSLNNFGGQMKAVGKSSLHWRKLNFFKTFYFEIIVDVHTVVRNNAGQKWWRTPVIPPAQEAEIKASPGKKIN